MRAIAIAVFIKDKQVIGVRLLRLPDKIGMDIPDKTEILDTSSTNVIRAMQNNQIEIVNLQIKQNRLSGYGAQLNRYANLNTDGSLNGKSPLVVLSTIKSCGETIGYIISDYKGKIVKASLKDALTYAKSQGVANGKIVNRQGTEYISQILGAYEQSDVIEKQEGDPNWTIEEFEQYMNSHGYKFSISDDYISYIDDRLKRLDIPYGITSIGQIKEQIYTSHMKASLIEVITIPSTVTYIEYNAFDRLDNLRQIIFSDSTEVVECTCFKRLINVEIKMPSSLKKLNYHASHVTAPVKVEYSKYKKLEAIKTCVQSSSIEGQIDLGTPTLIYRCCINLDAYDGVIKIPSTATEIIGSFKNLALAQLDFSNATSLENITSGSIHGIQSIKILNLSKCKNLKRIGTGCISSCPNLQEIILPEGLKDIEDGAISDCPNLTKVSIPKSIEHIGNAFQNTAIKQLEIWESIRRLDLKCKDTELVLHKDRELSNGCLENTNFKSVTIPDSIKEFKKSAMRCGDYVFNIPSRLEKIEDYALEFHSGMGIYDFSKCTNLQTVGAMAFEGCRATAIVFPEGLKSLGNRALRDMPNLKWIYLPKSIVEMGMRCMQGSGKGIELGLTVYTPKDSVAEAYCKRNGIKVVNVNTPWEDIDIEESSNQSISEKKANKFKLMLSNDAKHKELVSDKYINRADELYSIYLACSTSRDREKIELDTRRFKRYPMEELLPAAVRFELDAASNSQDIYTFNAWANLISNFCVDHSELISKDVFEYMEINDILKATETIFVIYRCNNNFIVRFKLRIDDKALHMYTIISDGNISFISICSDGHANSINNKFTTSDIAEEPIENKLKIGCTYPFKTHIYATFPYYIFTELKAVLLSQWTLVGSRILKKNQFGREQGLAELYFYSLASGKIIKTESRCDSLCEDARISIDRVLNIGIKNIYSIYDIPIEDRKIINDSLFNTHGSEVLIPRLVYRDSYIDKLKELPGAFDEPTECFEWELAKSLQEYGVNKPDLLNHKLAEVILNTRFFRKSKKKASVIKDYRLVYTDNIENDAYKIISFKITDQGKVAVSHKMVDRRQLYITILLKSTDKLTGDITCYLSNKSFETIFYTIYRMYNPKTSAEYYVDNKKSCNLDYQIISNVRKFGATTLGEWQHYEIALGVNKSSGVVYLLAGFEDTLSVKSRPTTIYKIYRYNSIEDALDCCDWLGEDRIEIGDKGYNGILNEVAEVIENIHSGTNVSEKNIVNKTRNMILNGYPNGYKLTDFEEYLFRLASKQRKLTC